MSESLFARNAQRLDAEYDGGNSDEGSDSDDFDDSPMKLDTGNTRKMKQAAKLGKKGKGKEEAIKKQKTGSATSRKRRGSIVDEGKGGDAAMDEAKSKDKKKDEDSVEEEIARITANLSTKRKPLADENLRTISALLEQTRKTQRGLLYSASADVSACDETQAEEEPVNRRMDKMDVDAKMPADEVEEVQPRSDEKCIICIRREGEKAKKFKIFMHDPMSKVFEAFCSHKNVDSSSLRFIFDGLQVSRDTTPQELDMEAGEENLIEARRVG